jgi:pSer/pThr/pTyr-binding forkhead associated (FHA) protein
MPTLSVYFDKFFRDENWRDITYRLDAPIDVNGHGEKGEWVLGRSPATDLTIAIKNVSRRHAVISYSYAASLWSLEDLGSQAGTFHNGKRLGQDDRPHLTVGDKIYLASNLINVVEDEQDTVEDAGPPTVASTTPIDYRPQVELATTPPPPPPTPTQAPTPTPSPKTYADTAYMALQWVMSPTTTLGGIYRLFLLALGSAVAVLVVR